MGTVRITGDFYIGCEVPSQPRSRIDRTAQKRIVLYSANNYENFGCKFLYNKTN